jgi:hypothetical protein
MMMLPLRSPLPSRRAVRVVLPAYFWLPRWWRCQRSHRISRQNRPTDRERKAIIRRRALTKTAKGKRLETAFSTLRRKARRRRPANRHPRGWWRDLTGRRRAEAEAEARATKGGILEGCTLN